MYTLLCSPVFGSLLSAEFVLQVVLFVGPLYPQYGSGSLDLMLA